MSQNITEGITIDPKKLRDARGDRTAVSVAEALDISRQHLWQIENGHRKPGSEILAKMLWLYNLKISDVANGFTNGKQKAA